MKCTINYTCGHFAALNLDGRKKADKERMLEFVDGVKNHDKPCHQCRKVGTLSLISGMSQQEMRKALIILATSKMRPFVDAACSAACDVADAELVSE